MTTPPPKDQINPEHYMLSDGREVIDFIDDITRNVPGDEAFKVSNIIKYISRYRAKGDPLKDLKKAQRYLNFLIDTVEKKEGENVRQQQEGKVA